jgi:hypothetical protein
MRKLLTLWFALAAIVGISASSSVACAPSISGEPDPREPDQQHRPC